MRRLKNGVHVRQTITLNLCAKLQSDIFVFGYARNTKVGNIDDVLFTSTFSAFLDVVNKTNDIIGYPEIKLDKVGMFLKTNLSFENLPF